MVRMKAARSFNYAGRDLAAGEEFEASENDAFVLAAALPPLANAWQAAQPAADEAGDQPPLPVMNAEDSGRQRRYSRRDMRAKG